MNRLGRANTTPENRAKQILLLRGCGRCGRRLLYVQCFDAADAPVFERDAMGNLTDVHCAGCARCLKSS